MNADTVGPWLDGRGVAKTDAAVLLTCVEITDCVQKCTGACPAGIGGAGCMLSCNNDCAAKGCGAAQAVYAKVSACVQQSCLLDCLGGGTGCQTCVQQKCATPAAQCAAQGC